jgi:hypothetical protein
LAVKRKETSVTDSYPDAAEGWLPGPPLARRLRAYGDQRRLFPRRRPPQLTPRTPVLGGWRVIRRQAIAGVRLTFTDGYRRSQAAGIGGNNASVAPLPGAVWMAGSAPVNGPEWLHLAGTPWSMRLAGGSGGRPALEIHAGGSLIDVVVASSPASQLLRGACTMAVARHPRAIAWGCLPTARSELPSVEFIHGRIRRRAQPEQAEGVAGWFWFADTDGRFSQVVVTSQDRRESCRTRTVDAC